MNQFHGLFGWNYIQITNLKMASKQLFDLKKSSLYVPWRWFLYIRIHYRVEKMSIHDRSDFVGKIFLFIGIFNIETIVSFAWHKLKHFGF